MDHIDRIVRRVDTTPDNGCWSWKGLHNAAGYGTGVSTYFGYSQLAHRAIYQLTVGPVDPSLHLDHLCRNRWCVNPDHLEPVTAAENSRRARPFATPMTVCKAGHPYDDTNTYVLKTSDGTSRRFCRACNRLRVAQYKARRRRRLAEQA